MDRKLTVITVEDELLVAIAIESTLDELGYKVVRNYVSASDFLADYKPGLADIIIMDIHLKGDMTGAQAGKVLSKISGVPIIYLTRVDKGDQKHMAIAESNASYYLSKPFNKADLDAALRITTKKINSIAQDKETSNLSALLRKDVIFIKEGQSHRPIKVSDIVYLKAEGSYCELYSTDRKYLYSENLSFFGDKLAFSPGFIRIHRSYIVNADFIEKIRDNSVWVNGEQLPIGKSYREGLLKKFRFLS